MNRPAFFRVPEFMLDMMFSKERAKIMTEGQKVLPNRVKELGFQYEFPSIEDATKDVSKFFYKADSPL